MEEKKKEGFDKLSLLSEDEKRAFESMSEDQQKAYLNYVTFVENVLGDRYTPNPSSFNNYTWEGVKGSSALLNLRMRGPQRTQSLAGMYNRPPYSDIDSETFKRYLSYNTEHLKFTEERAQKQLKLDRCYLRMAFIWAENSHAKRRQVGSLIVKNRMIISDGYNGTPSGFDNCCETEDNVTKECVLHAEANAITKLAKFGGTSSEGATIYITDEPCIDCAKLIIQSGIKRVVYCRPYRIHKGIELLTEANIEVEQIELEGAPEVPCP